MAAAYVRTARLWKLFLCCNPFPKPSGSKIMICHVSHQRSRLSMGSGPTKPDFLTLLSKYFGRSLTICF